MNVRLFAIASTPFRPGGLAMICAEARYASVLYPPGMLFDRRFGTVGTWQAFEREQEAGFPPDALPATSAVVNLLLDADRRTGVPVTYLHARELDVPATGAAQVLDRELRAQAFTAQVPIVSTP
jgi:hypothetical protein